MTVMDRPLAVAVGNSRKTKKWKNKTMLWAEIVERLRTTTRTPETVAEYKAMSRDRQSDVKDVGGFVGGYCKDGSRSTVEFRSVLCLDADFASASLWEDWLLLYGCTAVMYSTHKHTPAAPRFRLVLPLSRDVSPDEYQAIGRRVAEGLGIDQFDDTSYQPQRMMYWPSTSRDGEYVCKVQEGAFLDPDDVLATYHDWRDVSSWPMSSRVADVVKKTAAKQKDPFEKPGLVGAFCRAYSIREAIAEFVPEYTPAEDERYTYIGGSTACGVVIYDEKFSYSYHATDPASMQLCNAWDVVRLHRFGELDADTSVDTPATSRPSYKAMCQFATADARVKAQIIEDRTSEAQADFSEPAEGEADWRGQLKITDKGVLAQTIDNIVIILQNDARLAGCLAYNEMSHDIVAVNSLPWRAVSGESQWVDADDAALRYYLEKVYGLIGKDRIFDAVNVVAMRRSFHPVRDYLDACAWDGVPRVESLLVDYLGAEDSEYVRTVTRKTLVAAVARVFEPGCKFDYMLTLRGRQGLGKSALIAKLGGKWFSDSFSTLQGKDAYEQVQGVWLMEVGELAGMRKAEAETIKLYISKQSDRFRPAYGRRLQEFPRQCVFIGTTNESAFLRDATGNRRFWVVDTPNLPRRSLWDELTPEVVRLVWAEARHLYKNGEALFLPPALEEQARKVQAAYEEENPREGLVAEYLDRLLPEGWEDMDLSTRRYWLEGDEVGTVPRETVCTYEIWAEVFGGSPEHIEWSGIKEIRAIMARFPQWRNCGAALKSTKLYGRQRYYERSDKNAT